MENIDIFEIQGKFGKHVFEIGAYIYDSKEQLEKMKNLRKTKKQRKADAEAARLYAEAFGRDSEFYSFIKTLEVYQNTMDQGTSLVLSTDSDFLQYLKGYSEAQQ